MRNAVLIEPNQSESLEVISFRGSSEDKAIMAELAERLSCKQGAAVRIALRLTRDLTMLPRIVELGHRCYVNTVLRKDQDV